MPSKHHTDDVYKNKKRVRKNNIKFKVSLNEEQKIAKDCILENAITSIQGRAGSGKTFLAVQVALDMFFKKEVDKIIVTRPAVSDESLGFLPGDIKEKMDPWLAPIYHNLYMLYGKEKIDKHLEAEDIEIVPLAFVRGRTFVDSFIVVDEAQNVTHTQMEALLGRLGKGSKMAICGDKAQIDLRNKRDSGFEFLSTLGNLKGFGNVELLKNHRHSIVKDLLVRYEEKRELKVVKKSDSTTYEFPLTKNWWGGYQAF